MKTIKTKLDLFQVNTTAWDEEDFLLLTSLTEEQITEVIKPIVEEERERESKLFEGDNPEPVYWSELIQEYDNDFLVRELIKAYPNATIIHYDPNQIDLISI
jgi:hypothetical protein